MPLPPLPPVITRRLPQAPIGHADMLALQLGEPPLGGNRVLLLAGPAGARLAVGEAIAGALDHLNIDAAMLPPTAPMLLERLASRCRAGVQVNLLHDAQDPLLRPGGAARTLLRDAGVHLCERQPVQRRLLVADGRRALVGEAATGPGAFDLLLQIEGPAVQRLQRLFLGHWQMHAGATVQPARFFPPLAVAGTQRVAVATDDASGRRDGAFSALLGAVAAAHTRITLATGGRVPARRLVDALAGAAARGVAVDLLLPGPDDGRRGSLRGHGRRLLQAGARLWERSSSAPGTEVCVIDGLWASVGAGPAAPGAGERAAGRADVVVLDADFAARLEPMVRLQCALALPLEAAHPARRSWWERWREAVGARLDLMP